MEHPDANSMAQLQSDVNQHIMQEKNDAKLNYLFECVDDTGMADRLRKANKLVLRLQKQNSLLIREVADLTSRLTNRTDDDTKPAPISTLIDDDTKPPPTPQSPLIDVESMSLNDTAEERAQIKSAYTKTKGCIGGIIDAVMCANRDAVDEARIVKIIREMIDAGEVEPYEHFTGEEEQRAERNAQWAVQSEEHLNVKKKQSKVRKPTSSSGDMTDLAMAIRERQDNRQESFLDKLQAKHASGAAAKPKRASAAGASKKKRRKSSDDEAMPLAGYTPAESAALETDARQTDAAPLEMDGGHKSGGAVKRTKRGKK